MRSLVNRTVPTDGHSQVAALWYGRIGNLHPTAHYAVITLKKGGNAILPRARANLIGNIYGSLTVVADAPSRAGNRYLKCRCSCGNETDVAKSHLHPKATCGCSKSSRIPYAKLMKLKNTVVGVVKPKHFYSQDEQTKIGIPLQHPFWQCLCLHCSRFTRASTTQLVIRTKLSCGRPECEDAGRQAWIEQLERRESERRLRISYWDMRSRVRYDPSYSHVIIDDDWKGPDGINALFRDKGFPPPGQTLDRIDSRGHYLKSNCRWADKRTQSRNRFNVTVYNINGKEWVLWEIAAVLGVSRVTVGKRIAKLIRETGVSRDEAASKLLADGRKPAQCAVAA